METRGGERIQLPSGSFTVPELTAMLNTMPFDCTFVDKDDKGHYWLKPEFVILERG